MIECGANSLLITTAYSIFDEVYGSSGVYLEKDSWSGYRLKMRKPGCPGLPFVIASSVVVKKDVAFY
jgi:hypothetical protein